jgi:hypothetical protein
VNARVASFCRRLYPKTRAAPYFASWLYFDVLGHGRYRLLLPGGGVIQNGEAIQKEVNLDLRLRRLALF